MFKPSSLRFALTTLAAFVAAPGCSLFLRDPLPSGVLVVQEQGFATGPVDHRKLTVVVHAAPPPQLRAMFETASARVEDPQVAAFFRGHAKGGFGSGAYVVRINAGKSTPYVITNRHVVAESAEVEVRFGDGTSYRDCEVVYADPSEDIAFVQLPDSVLASHPYGYGFARSEISERDVVVAAGYPGVGVEPSYQLTDGKVANAKFTLASDARSRAARIQHTAPIDPGSSGGPLTNERGELLGINVALIRDRQSFSLAVPGSAVIKSFRTAMQVRESENPAQLLARGLGVACDRLSAELAVSDFEFETAVPYVSNEFVAREGVSSFSGAKRFDASGKLTQLFLNEPIDGMRASIFVRLKATAGAMQIAHTGACLPPNPSDMANLTSGNTVRMAMQTAKGPMELRWVYEHGNWRVAGGALLDLVAVADVRDATDAQASQSALVKAKLAKAQKRK